MSDGVSILFSGLDGLLADLRNFPPAVQSRVLRGAAATGASVIRKEAIRRAPSEADVGPVKPKKGHPPPGTLKRAIYQVRATQECTSTREVFKVAVRTGKRARKDGSSYPDAYYASWVEYGHFARVPHEMTKTAKAAGRMLGVARWVPAHPFMRPAIHVKELEALYAMRSYIRQQMPLAMTALKFLHAA